jgi:hypothetical protein
LSPLVAEGCPAAIIAVFTACRHRLGVHGRAHRRHPPVALPTEEESNAQADICQDVPSGEAVCDAAGTRASARSAAEKEKQEDLHESRGLRAANEKVPIDPRTLRRTRRTASLSCCCCPFDLAPPLPAPQVEAAALLQRVEYMFGEGHGRVRAAPIGV